MSNPAKSALIGYNYQVIVATLSIFLMEQGLLDINEVIPEVGPDGLSFDDILLSRENGKDIYLQTKNTTQNNINIKNNEVFFNGSKLTLHKEAHNVIVTKRPTNLEYNSKHNNFEYYKNEDVNLFVITLSPDDINDYIMNNFSQSRTNQLIRLSNDKFTNYHSINVRKEDLPTIYFYPTNLLETTYKVRNLKHSSNKVLFIVGKPGVGKSHLLNELNINPNRSYRFWISNQDEYYHSRLHYKNFLEDLSGKLFNSGKLRTEDEIIDKLAKIGEAFYIDGLDHVVNYANHELEKFMNFIKKVYESKNSQLVVLTRPLDIEIEYKTENLVNWTFKETQEYLRLRGIEDYSHHEKIYNITSGYPIITSYITSEYLENKSIKYTDAINNLQDYYDTLLKNVKYKNKLNIFTYTSSYITFSELEQVLEQKYKDTVEFINYYPFLFEIRENRISLFHDSFNNYINHQIEEDDELKEKFYKIVQESLLKEEINFMSRVLSFNLAPSFLSNLLNKYYSLDLFLSLKEKTIDFELLKQFYFSLRQFYSIDNVELLSAESAYEYSLILILLMRDNVDDDYEFMYQLYVYLKRVGIIWQNQVYSSGFMFSCFSYFESKDLSHLIRYHSYDGHKEEEIKERINDAITFESYFFNNLNKDNYNHFKMITHDPNVFPMEKRKLKHLLVHSYLHSHDVDGLQTIMKDYLNGRTEFAKEKLYFYLHKIGWEHIHVLELYSLEEAKIIIKQLGCENIQNEYNEMSLKEIIYFNANKGSFKMVDVVTSYIRLANYKNIEIDILSINLFYTMYYERKDYSVLGLSELLYELILKDLIGIKESFDMINSFQSISEKGIRNLSIDLVNMLGISYIEELEQLNIISITSNYNFDFFDLKTQFMNLVNESYAIRSIEKHVREKHRLFYGKSYEYKFDDDRYNQVLNSDYKDFFLKILNKYNFVLTNKEDGSKSELIKNSEKMKEHNPQESLNRGYIMEKDRNYYKDINMPYLDFAKYTDGWGGKLPYPDFLDLYDKNELKNNSLIIIQHIIAKSINANTHENYIYESYSDRGLLSGLPLFYKYTELDINWQLLKDLLDRFTKVLLIK